jgi:hypothetical protein
MREDLTTRERIVRTLNFQQVDRLPVIEWAPWWDKTLARWYEEGLPSTLTDMVDIYRYFGLDEHREIWAPTFDPGFDFTGVLPVTNEAEYISIKEHLYPEKLFEEDVLRDISRRQRSGECAVWMVMLGFFFFPRHLLGIENHMLAFYDKPDLMSLMNEDLLSFNLKYLDKLCEILVPDFITFAEDMSYNKGSMISRSIFEKHLAPFYRRITPALHERGIIAILDSDGDITEPIGWYLETGIDGFLPLERQAGVDIGYLRNRYPGTRFIGAFDKMTMNKCENRMREEFERLLPVMKQGGYIPGVDHQTPPGVSLSDYRLYVSLLKEYAKKATE